MKIRITLNSLAMLLLLGLQSAHAGTIISDATITAGSTSAAYVTGDTYTHPNAGEYTVPSFGEDVLAFTDRMHEWNGLTESGLPSFLVGGDYIHLSITARDDLSFVMNVTLAQTASLYLTRNDQFIDAELIPAWFSDNLGLDFIEVLDNQNQPVFVGIDGDRYPGYGVGAGVSVDDHEKLYIAVDTNTDSSILSAGTYTLYESATAGKNMYGVIASTATVPEPSSVALIAMGLMTFIALGWRKRNYYSPGGRN